ncbi:MAG: murein hydrolase activator EnvC family protein [Methylococcaceae bacterium]
MIYRLLLVFSLMPGMVVAETWPGAANDSELADIKEKLKTIQESRDSLESRKLALTEQLSVIERRYGRLARSRGELESQVKIHGKRITELKHRAQHLLDEVEVQHQGLAAQSRAAYAAGHQEWLKLIINSDDPARLSRILAYYNYLNRSRSRLIGDMQTELIESRRLQDELSQEIEQLRQSQTDLANEETELQKSRQARRQVLSELERGIINQDAQIKRLQENEQRLQRLLASIQTEEESGTPSTESLESGSLAKNRQNSCPVRGRVVEQFGSSRNGGRHGGILIAAHEGTPVRAISDGRVAFSDWLRGYGLITIVDHGDSYMSLYAYNQSLYKNVGDKVLAGEIIATVGVSGGRPEPGLFFGIREKGKPVNPLTWCNPDE